MINSKLGRNGLVDYGIFKEESDYRIHVCYKEGYAYSFPTKKAIETIEDPNIAPYLGEAPAYQLVKEREMMTAKGLLVPPGLLPDCERVKISDDIYEKYPIAFNDDESLKGKQARKIAYEMLRRGCFSMITIKEVQDLGSQMKGIDIIIIGNLKIQVKCDYKGGLEGTGFLYLQTRERNPHKKH